MYKDKDKQREANRERQRRYKAKHKGVTSEGVTDKALPGKDSLKQPSPLETVDSFASDGAVIGKPGDKDYNGVCMPEAWHG